jgi:hypothetical protein
MRDERLAFKTLGFDEAMFASRLAGPFAMAKEKGSRRVFAGAGLFLLANCYLVHVD